MAPDSTGPAPLSAKQETAALGLSSGKSAEDAATEAGTSRRTVFRWLADNAAFRERVQELRAASFSRATGKLSDLSAEAAEVLGKLMKSPTEGIQLQAARTILEQGPKYREAVDLAEEIAKLKRTLSDIQNGSGGDGSPAAPEANAGPDDRSEQAR